MEINALNQLTGLSSLTGNLNTELENGIEDVPVLAKRKGLKNIILDFQAVNHMNMDAVTALVKLSKHSGRQRIRLYVCGLDESYSDVFKMTGLYKNLVHLTDNRDVPGLLSDSDFRKITASGNRGKPDTYGWAQNFTRLKVGEKPEGAINKNVNNRKVLGPLQGFGPLWEKKYILNINITGKKPDEIITAVKQHFPEFQPPFNRFYPLSGGIAAGEVVLIDSKTPGGFVSTGVLVVYEDDTGFSLMTPQGHPEAGWVIFSASPKKKMIEMKIRGIASASDPFYELAFRFAGSKMQESIWKTVLSSLAGYLDIEDNVIMEKSVIDNRLNWLNSGNFWYNAQIRSLPYNLFRLGGKKS